MDMKMGQLQREDDDPKEADAAVVPDPLATQVAESAKAPPSHAANDMPATAAHQDPNVFGFSSDIRDLAKRIQELELPEHVDGDPVDFIKQFYRELCSSFEVLGWTYSRVARLKGAVLNKLYHIRPDKRSDSLLSRDEWTAFRADCQESDSTIENWRTIEDAYPLDNVEADKMGVIAMLKCIRDEKETDRSGAKPSHGTATTETDDVDGGDSKTETRWTLHKHLAPVITRLLKRLAGDLERGTLSLADNIRATRDVDLFDNSNKSLSLLMTERARLSLLSDALVDAASALTEKEQDVNAWIAEGQRTNRKDFAIKPLVTDSISRSKGEAPETFSTVLPE